MVRSGMAADSVFDARQAIYGAQRTVVFTGAGMSAESGIPTFRDAMNGLWSRFSAEALATADAFRRDPETVWGWYEWRRSRVVSTEPHAGHLAIAGFSRIRPGVTLITQNVDNLHERAGGPAPLHLHGSLFEPRCIDCSVPGEFDIPHPPEPESGRRISPPRCSACGGMLRPGVVWFGENLPESIWRRAEDAAANCDLMLCVGTSGVVYPAAGLPALAARNGATVIQINPGETSLDSIAHINLHGAAGEMLPLLLTDA